MTALKQLSAIYLAAASTFAVAIFFAGHPAWEHAAVATGRFVGVHGEEAAIAANTYIIQPGWALARTETAAAVHQIELAMAPKPIAHAPTRMAQAIPHPVARPDMTFAARAPVAKPVFHAPPQVAMRELPPVVVPKAQAPSAPANVAIATPPPALRPSTAETPNSEQQVASAPQKPFVLVPQTAQPAPAPEVTPENATPIPNLPAPSPAELVRVEQRLKDSLTSEMLANFDLFLYVSKAQNGPWAQRMYVFQKQTSGDLVLLNNWPVSTGREKVEFNAAGEKLPSYTPAGYYELDPKRFYPHYRSVQWDQPMPYSMFFNWVKDGNQTGLAIHGASGSDIAMLGTRASAGCVRLEPEAARQLFMMIRTQYRGLAPRFAMDRRTGTMSNDGILLHDASGKVQLADGYKVLVFIEDYGGENVVAALF